MCNGRHCGLVIQWYWITHEAALMVLRNPENFVQISSAVLRCGYFWFLLFWLGNPYSAPILKFLLWWSDPKNWSVIKETPRRYVLE